VTKFSIAPSRNLFLDFSEDIKEFKLKEEEDS
jgi:hypothetical protein